MSFWTQSNGEQATGDVKENSMEPLVKGWYTCMLEEVANKEWEDDRYINIKARVVAGPMQNRVAFLKLKVYETASKFYKTEARDNAIQKLVKLYGICKAKLPNGEPDDKSLNQLIDKPLDILLDVWKDQDTKEPKGNFIVNFEARGEKAGTAKTQQKQLQKPSAVDIDDDSIPF